MRRRIALILLAATVLVAGSAVALGATTQTSVACTRSVSGTSYTITCPEPVVTTTATKTVNPTVTVTATVTATATAAPASSTSTAPSPTTSTTAAAGGCALPAFPDASCTGVPVGTVLTAYTGPTTISTNGTVIDSKDIAGCLTIAAQNVVVKNSKITCNSWYPIVDDGSSTYSYTVQDTTITCGNTPGSTGTSGWNYTALRVNVSACENGFDVGYNVTLQDSYVHDLYAGGSAHTDAAQLNNDSYNVTFSHNNLDPGPNSTSAIIAPTKANCTNACSNIVVQDNLLGGGAYTLYCVQSGAAGEQVLNNHFLRDYAYGPVTDCADETFTGNVWQDTGSAVPVG